MQGKAGGGVPVAVGVPMAQPGYGQQAYGQQAYGQQAYGQAAVPVAQPMYGQAAVPVAQPMQRQTVVVPGAYLGPDTDVMIRHGFVRKVFGILLTQLLVTFGMIFYRKQNLDGKTL